MTHVFVARKVSGFRLAADPWILPARHFSRSSPSGFRGSKSHAASTWPHSLNRTVSSRSRCSPRGKNPRPRRPHHHSITIHRSPVLLLHDPGCADLDVDPNKRIATRTPLLPRRTGAASRCDEPRSRGAGTVPTTSRPTDWRSFSSHHTNLRRPNIAHRPSPLVFPGIDSSAPCHRLHSASK